MCDEREHRWHHRRPTALRAQVVIESGSPALDCTVQNLSAGGAQLSFAGPVELPAAFKLDIPTLDLRVDAKSIWRQDRRHGVTFVWPQHKEHGSRPSP